MEQLNPQILLISKAQNRIHWLTNNIFKYIQKCEMEHWSVRSTYFLGGKCNQGRKRREFRSPSAHPNPPLLSFKAETKRVPPFFFLFFVLFVLLNLGSKENHHSSQTLKTVSKVLQTQEIQWWSYWQDLEGTNRSNTNCQSWYHHQETLGQFSDFKRAQRLAWSHQAQGRWPKCLCLLAQGIKLLESQDPPHNGWAQGCNGLCRSWSGTFSFLKIPVLQPGSASG